MGAGAYVGRGVYVGAGKDVDPGMDVSSGAAVSAGVDVAEAVGVGKAVDVAEAVRPRSASAVMREPGALTTAPLASTVVGSAIHVPARSSNWSRLNVVGSTGSAAGSYVTRIR